MRIASTRPLSGRGRTSGPAARWQPEPDEVLSAVARHLEERADRAIDRADTKAGTIAATATAILAFAAQNGRFGSRISGSSAEAVLMTAGTAVWCVGIVVLTLVIFPRIQRAGAPHRRLTFFADFPRRLDPEDLGPLLHTATAEPEWWLMIQAHELSRIALFKFRLIQAGMILLALGAALTLPGLVIT